jgi:hypothetical protein
MSAGDPEPQVCFDCGKPGRLVRARRVLPAAELENSETMLGGEEWFHRQHVPLGWRVVDFDPETDEFAPPEV